LTRDRQATATSRACYVCSKPTTVCLATTNAIDFLYACEAHLSDTGFATELVDPAVAAVAAAAAAAAAKEAVSKEEIERIKAEWEAKEARKKDKDKDKDSEAKSGGKDAGGEAEMEEGGGKNGAKSPSPAAGSGSGAATPTHKRYSLHRDFFAMRQAEHRRKRQTNQTQELAPRLPGAPRGSLLG
jgi:hypothetical protein